MRQSLDRIILINDGEIVADKSRMIFYTKTD